MERDSIELARYLAYELRKLLDVAPPHRDSNHSNRLNLVYQQGTEMRKLFLITVAVTISVFVGYDRNGKTGGPDANDPDHKNPVIEVADNAFVITAPDQTIAVKPGEVMDSTIKIMRGKTFKEDVIIAFEDVPSTVTLNPSIVQIPANANRAIVQVKTADDATPGEYLIRMIGHPKSGADATSEFKLKIGKNEKFSFIVPFETTTLHQGESKDIMIGVIREYRSVQDVSIRFDQLPNGLTIVPATMDVPKPTHEAKFTIKAAKDASIGDFNIKVIGHLTSGNEMVHDLKVHVSKK